MTDAYVVSVEGLSPPDGHRKWTAAPFSGIYSECGHEMRVAPTDVLTERDHVGRRIREHLARVGGGAEPREPV